MTPEDIQIVEEKAREIARNLTINPKGTKKHYRSLISSGDSRQSARAVGLLGIILLLSFGLIFVVPDLINIVRFLCRKREEYNLNRNNRPIS